MSWFNFQEVGLETRWLENSDSTRKSPNLNSYFVYQTYTNGFVHSNSNFKMKKRRTKCAFRVSNIHKQIRSFQFRFQEENFNSDFRMKISIPISGWKKDEPRMHVIVGMEDNVERCEILLVTHMKHATRDQSDKMNIGSKLMVVFKFKI